VNSKDGVSVENAQLIIHHLFTHLKNKPLYAAVSTSENMLEKVKDHLQLTGLLYLISTEKVNTSALIRKNFEKVFRLDYLDTKFKKDISQYHVDCLNTNYIVPMFSLYEDYGSSGEQEKKEEIKNRIIQLAEYCEDKEEILKQFKK
jgi:hypothetical protein